MRKDTKSELQMLREFVWYWAGLMQCWFCGKPLLTPKEGMTWGHRRHASIPTRLVAHHIEHDREKNERKDIGWAHKACHDKYHKQHRSKKDDKAQGTVERANAAGSGV